MQFLKDLQLQLRAVVTNVCQLLVPVIFISFAGVMQLVVNHLLHKNGDVVPGSNTLGIPGGMFLSLIMTAKNMHEL